MRHRKINDLYNLKVLGLFQHFQSKEEKLLVMTSKCIKLRICTLSCYSWNLLFGLKYNMKSEGKNKNKQKETLRTKVNLILSLMFCKVNCRLYLRGILSFLPFKSYLQCQYFDFCFIISKVRLCRTDSLIFFK